MGWGPVRGLHRAEGMRELGEPVEAVGVAAEEEAVELVVMHRQLLLLPQGVLVLGKDAVPPVGLGQ